MCTGIKFDFQDGCVLGRTMDFEVPLTYNALYLPRGYHFADDLMGRPMYSKYKSLGVCFNNRTPLKDGVNEHGLVGITNTFTGFNLYANKVDPEKTNISSLDYFTFALGKYKTVDELVEDLPNIHISSKDHRGEDAITPDFHFMFSDPSKRCVVVEPKRRELVYYDNPYNVMTNSPGFESHVKKLKRTIDLDNIDEFIAAKNLPGGYDPSSRFIKAFHLTKMNVPAANLNEAYSHFFNIMGAMAMPEGFVQNKKYEETTYTRYTCGYDTVDKLLNVKAHTNPTVYQLSFDDVEDENRRQAFFIQEDFMVEKLG